MELKKRNKLIEDHLGLVNRLAKKQKIPSQVYCEDLESAGYLGLVEAAQKYNEQAEFTTYAVPCIAGSIKDYLRELAYWGHSMPIPTVSIDYVSQKYPERTRRNDSNFFESAISVYDRVCPNDFFDKVIRHLPPRGKKLICWYFIDNMTFKEIGNKLGISESYVCQLLTKYKNKIKEVYSEFELRQELR